MESSETPEQLILTEEKIGFDPTELIACGKCGRNNAPNRLRCMYCAAALDVPESIRGSVRIQAASPEIWENGVNVLCVKASPGPIDITAAAESVGIDAGILRNILTGPLPLPLTRVQSETEAKLVMDRLAVHGVETILIHDNDLRVPPRRLRAVEIVEGEFAFIPFNSDDVVRITSDEINLIVLGKIIQNELSSTEIRKFRGGEFDDQIVTRSKSGVIDIYVEGGSFRIHEHGFDFSCLGVEKSYVAAQNIDTLINLFRENAVDAVIDEAYGHVRELLEPVWGMTEVQEAGGVSRTGMGKLLVKRTITQSNLDQFNKYSQMRRQVR